MRLALLMLIGLLMSPGVARAAPLDAALQSDLLALYARYNKALAAGNLKDAVALRTAGKQAEFKAELKRSPKAQSGLLAMARDMAPDSVEPLHATLSADGNAATIVTLGSKTVPAGLKIPNGPKPGTVVKAEITLDFIKEGGVWKFENQTFGMDPSRVKPCQDEAVEASSAYDSGRDLSFGGPIQRVDYKPDHTLLVIRVLDEENCAILPKRGDLKARGIDPDALAPYVIVEMTGHPHRSDSQRAIVTDLRVLPPQ